MIHRSFWFYVRKRLSKIEPYFIFLNIPNPKLEMLHGKDYEEGK
jgi:hypothetical protein